MGLVSSLCGCRHFKRCCFPCVNIYFFSPGAGGAHWEGPRLSAGTHQDGAALPVQPKRPNTGHVLRGHHHKSELILSLSHPSRRFACFHSSTWPPLSSPELMAHSLTSLSVCSHFFFLLSSYRFLSSPFLTLSKTACPA